MYVYVFVCACFMLCSIRNILHGLIFSNKLFSLSLSLFLYLSIYLSTSASSSPSSSCFRVLLYSKMRPRPISIMRCSYINRLLNLTALPHADIGLLTIAPKGISVYVYDIVRRVCLYSCIYSCMCMYVYVCYGTCMCMYMFVHVYVYVSVGSECMDVYMYVYVYVRHL